MNQPKLMIFQVFFDRNLRSLQIFDQHGTQSDIYLRKTIEVFLHPSMFVLLNHVAVTSQYFLHVHDRVSYRIPLIIGHYEQDTETYKFFI